MNNVLRKLFLTVAAFSLGACGSADVSDLSPGQRTDYQRETQAEINLEIPPDLTSTRTDDRMAIPDNQGVGGANYSEFAADRRARGVGGEAVGTRSVLPENPEVAVQRDGDRRWLLVAGDIDAVWIRVLAFWQERGIALEEQNPNVGIMRTAWLENRATISRDAITDALRNVLDGLYETGFRDQYRVRFERTDKDGVEIYLTHYGLEEVVQGVSEGQTESTIWTRRPRDPELEIEMLRHLMVFLGVEQGSAGTQLQDGEEQAETEVLSQLTEGPDGAELHIDREFTQAWRMVGLVLDRVGFVVEDRDRSQGVYHVRYSDPAANEGGLLSALKFWEDKPEDVVEQCKTELPVLEEVKDKRS